jgi:hypothetical protein
VQVDRLHADLLEPSLKFDRQTRVVHGEPRLCRQRFQQGFLVGTEAFPMGGGDCDLAHLFTVVRHRHHERERRVVATLGPYDRAPSTTG